MGNQHMYFCEVQNEHGAWRRTDHMALTRKKLRIVIAALGDEWKSKYYSGHEAPDGRKMYRFMKYIPLTQVRSMIKHHSAHAVKLALDTPEI